jgi:HEAT repeat protein
MKFQDLDNFTNDDIADALTRNDPDELQFVALTVALEATDLAAAQPVCIRLCSHHDRRVKGNAMVSLGHLARRFRALDEPSVKPLIECGLQDADEYVRTSAKSAADEIHQFLHWTITGHVYG